jgi:L-iditol 2-dehydrogenase
MCIDLIASGRVCAEKIITHRYAIDQAVEAFRVADKKSETGAVKVLLKMG